MEAIVVKYLSPTNTLPARLVATCPGGRLVEVCLYSDMAFQATLMCGKLVNKMNWIYSDKDSQRNEWIRGELPGDSYVFVCKM